MVRKSESFDWYFTVLATLEVLTGSDYNWLKQSVKAAPEFLPAIPDHNRAPLPMFMYIHENLHYYLRSLWFSERLILLLLYL